MSEQAAPPEGAGRRRATRRRRPSRRLIACALVGLFVIVAVSVAWVGIRGVAAKNRLDAANAATDQLRAQLLENQTTEAAATLADIRGDTAKARQLTSDPLWRAAGALPFVGDSADAVTTTTDAVDQVAQDVLPVLVAQSRALSPSTVRVDGDRIDVDRIAGAAPDLAAAAASAKQAAAQADSVDVAELPARLRAPMLRAQSGLAEVEALTADASAAAQLLPSMLGADGPKRYFLAFQSNAELRGTGGLVGAYGVLEADRGRVRVVELGPRTKLESSNGDQPALDFGADYRSLYGEDPGLWVNTNLSPHFPYAAQLWLAMYEKQTGEKLDGAIATDPVALGYVLDATGGTTLRDGTKVTAANAARLTMSDVYTRFPDSDAKRDAFLQSIARGAMTNLLSGKGDPSALASSLGKAAGERRLFVYSADASDQRVLETTPLSGSVAATSGPYVGVFANSGTASKLDYYLDASVDYVLQPCTAAASRRSSVALTLENTAPATGLTPYVSGPLTSGGKVSNLDLVAVHLPVGAVVRSATLDGKVIGVSPHTLLGRPVVTFPVRLGAGQKAVVELQLAEPASAEAPRVEVAALAEPARVSVTPAPCASL